jgi:hypothetical protein
VELRAPRFCAVSGSIPPHSFSMSGAGSAEIYRGVEGTSLLCGVWFNSASLIFNVWGWIGENLVQFRLTHFQCLGLDRRKCTVGLRAPHFCAVSGSISPHSFSMLGAGSAEIYRGVEGTSLLCGLWFNSASLIFDVWGWIGGIYRGVEGTSLLCGVWFNSASFIFNVWGWIGENIPVGSVFLLRGSDLRGSDPNLFAVRICVFASLFSVCVVPGFVCTKIVFRTAKRFRFGQLFRGCGLSRVGHLFA